MGGVGGGGLKAHAWELPFAILPCLNPQAAKRAPVAAQTSRPGAPVRRPVRQGPALTGYCSPGE